MTLDDYGKLTGKEYRFLLIPTIIGLVVLITAFIFVKPAVEKIGPLRKNLEIQKQKLAQLTSKVAALKGLDPAELEDESKVSLAALPEEKNIPLTLSAVKNTASASGVAIKKINSDPGEISSKSAAVSQSSKNTLPSMAVLVSIAGTFDQIKDFFGKIDTILPLIRAGDFKMTAVEGRPNEATITFYAFFLPLPTTIGEIDKPISPISVDEEKAYRTLKGFGLVTGVALPSVPSGKENIFSP